MLTGTYLGADMARTRVSEGQAAIGYGDAQSKASYALRCIRIDIVAGVLKPGQKLSFGMLTAAYRVGVSPLREALCQLMGRGLVVLKSQRGFRVTPVSSADLADVVAVRRHIEVYALGLSIDHADQAWRLRLQRASEAFSRVAAKAGDQRPISEDWQDIHRAYHFALIGACGSPNLLNFCEQVYDQFDRYRRLAIPVQSFQAGPARDHHEITKAAIIGSRATALALLARHIDDIAEVVTENFALPAGGGTERVTPAANTRTARSAPARSRRARA
jgi:GntR family carbon starvation induced transcriptional regulator